MVQLVRLVLISAKLSVTALKQQRGPLPKQLVRQVANEWKMRLQLAERQRRERTFTIVRDYDNS
jgi:hypothetical protein